MRSLKFDLQYQNKVKSNGAVGIPKYDLLTFNSNVGSNSVLNKVVSNGEAISIYDLCLDT